MEDVDQLRESRDLAEKIKVHEERSVLIYPIYIGQQLIGSIGISSKRKHYVYTKLQRDLLYYLSQQLSSLLEDHYNQIKYTVNPTIDSSAPTDVKPV